VPRIEVRPVEPGEEALWIEIDPAMRHDPAAQEEFTALFVERRKRDPRSFLLAFDGTRCVGRLEGIRLNPRLYFIREILAADDEFAKVAGALARFLSRSFAEDGIEILAWDSPEAAPANRVLERSGFVLDKKKAFVEKDIHGYRSPHEDPFTYRSLAEVGEDRFIEVMSEAARGDPFEDMTRRDARAGFRDLIEYAGKRFDPTWWRIAYVEGEPAGVVLPQAFEKRDDEGTLFYVAVRPAFRGRKYGRVLHAAGLEFLSRKGIVKYVGSTDARNFPMLAVFQTNGCRQTGTQLFYKAVRKEGAS
jgi:GNAT superfamily N-acetyltransferase